MARVVVPGGAGFLGSHLCERLVADGCEVVALDNPRVIFDTHGQRMRCDGRRAIPACTMQASQGEPITVADDGSQARSVMYVDNSVGSRSPVVLVPRPVDDPSVRQPDITLARQ